MKCAICLEDVSIDPANALDDIKLYHCDCNCYYHNKCISKWFVDQNYDKCFCPQCKKHLSFKELRDIFNRTTFSKYLDHEYNKCYNTYLQSQASNIAKFKRLQELLLKFQDINKLKKLVSEMKGLIRLYERFEMFENDLSETQSTFSDDEARLEEFNATCSLFTLTTLPADGKAFLEFAISAIDKDVFLYSATAKVNVAEIELVKQLYQKLKSSDIYKEALPFAIEEIEIMKTKKTTITKYLQLAAIQKELVAKVMFPCQCGGRIMSNGYCDRCFSKYCNRCYKQHDGECINEDVEAIKTMIVSTRACPNCATRIEKESDCDHMWCMRCHIGFDWVTGEVILTNFKNPHRDAWLKENGLSLVTYLDVIQLHDEKLSIPKDEEHIKQYFAVNPNAYPNVSKLLTFVFISHQNTVRRIVAIKNKIIYRILENDKTNNKRLMTSFYYADRIGKLIESFVTVAREIIKTAIVCATPEAELEISIFEHLKVFALQFNELITTSQITLNIYTCLNRSEICYHSIKQFADYCCSKYGDDVNVKSVFSHSDTAKSIRMEAAEIDRLLHE